MRSLTALAALFGAALVVHVPSASAEDLFLWGRLRATNPASLVEPVAIGAGTEHTAIVRANGSVEVWGDNYTYAAATPPAMTDAIAAGCGQWHGAALRATGAVVTWGSNASGQQNIPAGLLATAISVGGAHTLALRSNGTVAAWGLNDLGQCTVPATAVGIVQVAAGHRHSLPGPARLSPPTCPRRCRPPPSTCGASTSFRTAAPLCRPDGPAGYTFARPRPPPPRR